MKKTAILFLALGASLALAQSAPPPPRTISDINALLDQYKPDSSKIQALKATVGREPPAGADPDALFAFYRERANAAQELGMVRRQIDDLREAIKHAPAGDALNLSAKQDLFSAELRAGNFFNAFKLKEEMLAEGRAPHMNFNNLLHMATLHLTLGDIAEARSAVRQAEAIVAKMAMAVGKGKAQLWVQGEDQRNAHLENVRGQLLDAEGKYAEAEAAYRKAIAARDRHVENLDAFIASKAGRVPPERFLQSRDGGDRALASNLLRQGRLREAELLLRDVLKRELSRVGRDAPGTAQNATMLANVFAEQGRFADAEAMARAALGIHREIGSVPEAMSYLAAQRALGSALVAQSRWADAIQAYEAMRAGLAGDPATQERFRRGDLGWGLALVKTGRSAEAVPMLETMANRTRERLGDRSYALAEQRGFLAIALADTGQRARALREYQQAIPILLAAGLGAGGEEDAAGRLWRATLIIESYVSLLYDIRNDPDRGPAPDPASEAFRVADALRGGRTQRALSASSARAAAGTPALAELIRREQDSRQQASMLYEVLLRLLNAPADQQLPQVASQVRSRIRELEKEQRALAADLERRFPAYAGLVDPRPATVDAARAALREGEVLVSILVTEQRSYVWALPKSGPMVFHASGMGERTLARLIAALRRGLDPGDVPLERFPEFDVAAAHRLYAELLGPVESAWKGARALIVVANGPAAQLPLSVLPTEAVSPAAGTGLRFESYRQVPWLARQIAVAQLPSASTLSTLRGLPPGNAARSAFIGFGDPDFGGGQGAGTTRGASFELRKAAVTRVGEGVRYNQLAPLPDTREEILAMAQALKADSQKDVFLGAQASKQNVKGHNLATRRIVAFATHGLIPGDFPDLDEPALALSAPDGKAETGLLTLGDILGLKLDADWVVLSACNTAAGDGAGAEAISGLGRGFFYAGSRALLVTHWPVETRSARQLVTTLFERYAADPKLSRAEALRQASLAVMEDTAKDASGKALFSYAHPLFWAPYALVGDGGR